MRRLFASGFLLVAALAAQDWQWWRQRGVQAFQAFDFPQAAEAFQKAIELNPGEVELHLYLGQAWYMQFKPCCLEPEHVERKAEDEFAKVLELDPDNTAALASLASLSFYEGNLDNATSWNKKLVAVAPQNKDAYYFLGLLAWRKSYPAYATARAQAKMSERKRRPLPPSAVKQKLISSFSSVIEDGISNLKRALELDPDYDDAMTYMSLLISERAGLRDSAKECSRDLATAKEWAQRALETKKRKAATSGAPDRMPLQQDVQCSTIDRLYPA